MAHVLIVDDDRSFLETWTAALRHDGHSVDPAGSIASARGSISARVPEIAVVDWKLPDGSGLQVVRTIVRRHLHVATAVVTGFWADDAYSDLVRDARALGVAEIIRRGIDVDDVPDDVVRRLLAPKQRRYAAAVCGDEDARESTASELLHLLVPMLNARFHHVPRDMVADAVADAVVEWFTQRRAFGDALTPERDVYVAAKRNLQNLLRSDRRRLERETAAILGSQERPPHRRGLHPSLQDLIDVEPAAEIRRALFLWLKGDHGLDPWLTIPKFAGWRLSDVRREVKRAKDAFVMRAKRRRGTSE